jgi:hypothetical protein
MERAKLDEATFTFSQEGNCMDYKNEHEVLEIKCMSDLGIDEKGNCFYVLKTESWSIDNLEELQELIDRIKKSLQLKKNV